MNQELSSVEQIDHSEKKAKFDIVKVVESNVHNLIGISINSLYI